MADKAWKAAERRTSSYFGSERNSLSGGNSKLTRSDSIHPKLYIECKWGQRHAIWTLFDETKPKARKEGKIPVLIIHRKGSPGFLIAVHSDHFEEVRLEKLKVRKKVKV